MWAHNAMTRTRSVVNVHMSVVRRDVYYYYGSVTYNDPAALTLEALKFFMKTFEAKGFFFSLKS